MFLERNIPDQSVNARYASLTERGISVEQIAAVAHGANRAFCQTIGDNSHLDWNDSPLWQRASSVAGVEFAIEHLDTVTPKMMYSNWAHQKMNEGWVYGPEKDPVKKTHPCLAGYESLPDEQKQKDNLFIAVVKSFF